MKNVLIGLKSFDIEIRNLFYCILLNDYTNYSFDDIIKITSVLEYRMENAYFENTVEYTQMNFIVSRLKTVNNKR